MKISSLRREFRRYALVERGLKPATLRDILAILGRLCRFTATDRLQELTTPAIKAFLYDGRLELGWGAKTFRLYRQYLKTFFDWCHLSGYVESNPVMPIERPRLPQSLPRCLSHSEAQRILYSAGAALWRDDLQRTRAEAIIATFLMTGLRRGELLRLRRADLDMESGILTVRGGKGRKDRSIPVHPRLAPTLRRHFAETARTGHRSEWVFSSIRSGSRLTAKNLYAILKRIARKAKVKFTPHMLRHTFGRELVEANFNIYKLKEVMGHASVATTQSYVALSPQNIKASFEQAEIY